METSLRICSAPNAGGYIPLIIVVRAGAQTGAFDQHRLYRNPRPASPSSTGVFANESPKHPIFGLISSQVIHKIFGRRACAAKAPAAKNDLRVIIPPARYAKIHSFASG